MPDVKLIKTKRNKDKIESAVCPYCNKENTKEVQCEHFMKRWSPPYRSVATGDKIGNDVYYFKKE